MIKKLIVSVIILAMMIMCSCNAKETTDENTENIPSSSVSVAKVSPSSVSETETESDLDTLSWPKFETYSYETDADVKNIILVIGDGMGENIIKVSEIVKGEKLLMQGLEHTTHVTTDSLDGTTDSAASSTAMSTGYKTYNKYIGVDKDKNSIETICEFAKAKGMKTGLVVTQIVNHATPAGMAAHTDYRGLYNEILKQEINAETDVILGGGSEYHTKKIDEKLNEKGYTFIDKEDELLNLTYSEDQKILGMFAYNALYAGTAPSLATMTDKALELLDNKNGFFMMVEGSNIDIQLQNEDMAKTINEMTAFDKTVDVILKYAHEHKGTLVIITADHETGGVILPESEKAENINDDLITSGGEHTSTPVLLMAAGAKADIITEKEMIDNTDISKYMREFLDLTYGKREPNILS